MSENSEVLNTTETVAVGEFTRPDPSQGDELHQEITLAGFKLGACSDISGKQDVFNALDQGGRIAHGTEALHNSTVASDEQSQPEVETSGSIVPTSFSKSSTIVSSAAQNTHEFSSSTQPSFTSSTLVHEHFDKGSFPKNIEKVTFPKNIKQALSTAEHVTVSKSVTTPLAELSVPEYFAGKGVLITGATGFIGKVLIEKLLRCCPQLDCIYCLVRPKNKQTIQSRLDEITNSRVSFDVQFSSSFSFLRIIFVTH